MASEHTKLLRKTEEARLDDLFKTKCDKDGQMNIVQFFLFAIERNMISNKNGVEIFYAVFKEAAGDPGTIFLDYSKFHYAIYLLARTIYHSEESPIEAMFSQMLTDKVMTTSGLFAGRVPKIDELTLNILSEECLIVYIHYLEHLKQLYTNFIHQNFNAGKKVISWKEIEEKNLTVITKCFVKMAKNKKLIPHMFNIEDMQSYLKATIPPLTADEYKFFENNEIIRFYEADMTAPNGLCDPQLGEPGLLFHEFIFMFARIALNHKKTKGDFAGRVRDLFYEDLGFPDIPDYKMPCLNFEDITRKLNPRRKGEEGDEEDEEYGDEEWDSGDEIEMDENQKRLMEFLSKKAEEEKDFIIDYDAIISEIDPILPNIPGRPVVEQINPRPYKLPRIMFGKLMPKKDDDDAKGKKKKQAKKAPARKKDEPPPKPVKWAPPPSVAEPGTLEIIRNAKNELMENIFPSNIRGEHANAGVAPTIIKEVYYPPDAPQEIATLIESGIVYQNTGYFEQSIDCFEKARQQWRDIQAAQRLRPEIEMYFEMSLGSVYESCGKDDIAMSCYIRARKINLVYNHPDQAFPYCGLGSVLFHTDEPAWAIRCYLKAREIREERLGGDTVDTATVYNNLGCCMYMLERNQECLAYFELAEAILECELGPSHERTMTASRNIMKAKRTVLDIKPEFRQLWTTALPHPAPKGKKGKKGGKKKKK